MPGGRSEQGGEKRSANTNTAAERGAGAGGIAGGRERQPSDSPAAALLPAHATTTTTTNNNNNATKPPPRLRTSCPPECSGGTATPPRRARRPGSRTARRKCRCSGSARRRAARGSGQRSVGCPAEGGLTSCPGARSGGTATPLCRAPRPAAPPARRKCRCSSSGGPRRLGRQATGRLPRAGTTPKHHAGCRRALRGGSTTAVQKQDSACSTAAVRLRYQQYLLYSLSRVVQKAKGAPTATAQPMATSAAVPVASCREWRMGRGVAHGAGCGAWSGVWQ